MASSSTTAMDATSSYHPNAFFSSTSASIAPNTSSSSTSNSFPNPPSISVSSSSATKVSHFQGSFDRPSVLPPMGPLSDFPDMDNVMAQVRSFLDRSGASKHVANEPRFMSVEPEESDGAAGSRARTLEGDFGDQNHLQEPPRARQQGLVGGLPLP
ncbi:hypothetical protein BC829DRAFT_105465 [Chytridium lagenaria]|nr:hypothetical protein BC829DRAFT_105465 [Chytridium lagenaria]